MPKTADLPPVKAGTSPDPPPLFPPNFQQLTAYTDWRNTWTHIVSGKFSASPYSGLLFYDQNSGYAEFYETDGQGGITFLRSHSGWRQSWTHIVPGAFFGPDRTGLLFYDQQAGYAAIYDTKEGDLINISEHSGWRPSWTHITTVRLPGSGGFNDAGERGHDTALVLYDQAAGHGEIHSCDASGNLKLIMQSDGWRTTWTHVVGDSVAGTGLLFYEASTGYGEIYTISGDEANGFQFGSQVTKTGLPSATHIIPGNFGWQDVGYLFYDRQSGHGTFVYNNTGEPDPILISTEAYTDWRMTWDIVVPGEFWTADPEDVKFRNGFTDLLFYDSASGYGEFHYHEPYEAILINPLEGYAFPNSLVPGETISFYVNKQSSVGPIAITIYRQDADQVLMTTIQNVQQFQPLAIGRLDYRDGPTWPPVADLIIPPDWPSGLYVARVEAVPLGSNPVSSVIDTHAPIASKVVSEVAQSMDIPFVVRAAVPGSQSGILLYIPDTTYEAYNFWGGRSLYGFMSMGAATWSYGSPIDAWPDYVPPRAFGVSFARPYSDAVGLPRWQYWEVPLIRWLARQGIAVELCTASDLHKDWANNAGLLQNYRLLISIGHDEYWSKEMRDNVEGFATAGGNVVFLSGNVCWWQVRFDPDVRGEICYKDPGFDTFALTEPGLTTGHWMGAPVCRPSTSLTGVSWNMAGQSPVYRVRQPDHWVFAGLNFTTDSWFGFYKNQNGGETSVVNTGETDSYQSTQSDSCSPSSPSGFARLADAPPLGQTGDDINAPVTATVGIFTKGKGQVFTVGAVNWSLGLSQGTGWNEIDQITRNVLTQLGSAPLFRIDAGFATTIGTSVAVVARNPDHLDLFVTGADGGIHSAYWDSAGGWASFFRIDAGFATTIGTSVAVVARTSDHLDLFVTGADGGIHSAYWDSTSGWSSFFRIDGGFATKTGTSVAVAARTSDHLDLFVTGADGGIHSAYWDSTSGWSSFFRIDGGFATKTGTSVAVVARDSDHLDLFVTGADGGIHSAYWDSAGGWASFFRIDAGFATTIGTSVAVVARTSDHLDLFVTGADGGIHSAYWDSTSGWSSFFRIDGGFATKTGTSVAVAARTSDHLDLFVTGADGGIHSAYWDSTSGWSSFFRIDGGFATKTGTSVAVVARDSDHLDLFVTGADGGIYSTYRSTQAAIRPGIALGKIPIS